MSKLSDASAISRWKLNRGFTPHYHQRVMFYIWLTIRFLAICAGRRSGKTRGGAHAFAMRMVRDFHDRMRCRGRFAHLGAPDWDGWVGSDPMPLLEYWIVAPTYKLLGPPKKALQRILGRASAGGLVLEQNQTEGFWLLRGGIKLVFRTAQNPEWLVGEGIAGLWLEEAARVKSKAWHDALRSTVADLQGWVLFTTTPLGRNWWWRDVWCLGDPSEAELASDDGRGMVTADPRYGCIRWNTADNTAVPGLAQEAEEARGTLPDALWRRNFEAAFDAFVGQCLELDAKRHLVTKQRHQFKRSDFARVVAGYDQGGAHPGVFTVWGSHPNAGFVEVETVSRTRTAIVDKGGDGWVDIALAAHQRWGFEHIRYPADAYEAAAQFRQAGLRAVPAHQDRISGLQWFATGLHNDEVKLTTPLVFHRFQGLHHPEGRTGREADLWVKEEDDEFDAARYALSEWIRDGRLASTKRLRLIKSVLQR